MGESYEDLDAASRDGDCNGDYNGKGWESKGGRTRGYDNNGRTSRGKDSSGRESRGTVEEGSCSSHGRRWRKIHSYNGHTAVVVSPRSPMGFYHGEWGSVGEGGSRIGYWGSTLYPTIQGPCKTCSSASSRASSNTSRKRSRDRHKKLSSKYVSDRRRRASERSPEKKSEYKEKLTKSLEDNLDSDSSPVRTRRDGGICSTLCWGYGRPESMERVDRKSLRSPTPHKGTDKDKHREHADKRNKPSKSPTPQKHKLKNGRPDSKEHLDSRDKSRRPDSNKRTEERVKSPRRLDSKEQKEKKDKSPHSPSHLKHKTQQENVVKKEILKTDFKEGIDFMDVYQSQLWCEVDGKEKEGVHKYKHLVKKETKI